MSGSPKGAALLGAACLAATVSYQIQAGGSQANTSSQTPTFRAGVNVVRVDVIASDKTGAFVSGLTPDDFDVTEEGKPQKIDTFRLVMLDGGRMPSGDAAPRAITSDADEAREAARDDVRLFGVFFDDYHVSREASLQTRDTLARFVDRELGPSDMVGLMYPLTATSSVLFTRRHDTIESAIAKFTGRKGEYDPKNTAEENVMRQFFDKPGMIEQIRNEVAYSALDTFISHLGGFKAGRKTLIIVTEGFAGGLASRGRSAESNLQALYTDANRGNVSVYWVDPRMLGGLAPGDGEWLWDERCECLVWKPGPVSLRSLTQQQDPLRALSQYTDGRALIQRNDLGAGLSQIVRDSSSYYLLGYNSTFTGADGKFHGINVRVKRPGVEVRARKGYWALSRDEMAAATAPAKAALPAAVESALGAAAVVSHARFARTWVGAERGDNGQTRVTVIWEPAGGLSSGGARAPDEPARLVVTAAGADGAPYFRGAVASRAVGAARGAGVSFDVPPGRMGLRLSIEGSGAAVLDTETRDMEVPNFAAAQVALSTPQVYRARTLREMQQFKDDAQAIASIGRDFSRGDRLLVRFRAYGAVYSSLVLSAHLLGQTGQALSDIPIAGQRVEGSLQEAEVPLAALSPGDYLIEVKAVADAAEARELVGFHVAN